MKISKSLRFLLLLGGIAGYLHAEEKSVAVTPAATVSSSEQPLVEQQPIKNTANAAKTKAFKYVRNITMPNGFGESVTFGDAVFFAKSGDVKADGGDVLEYAVVVTAGDADVSQALVRDTIPPFTEYIAGSTRLNGVALDDVDGISRVIAGVPVNDTGSAFLSGVIRAGQSAVLMFRVRVNLMLELPAPAVSGEQKPQ